VHMSTSRNISHIITKHVTSPICILVHESRFVHDLTTIHVGQMCLNLTQKQSNCWLNKYKYANKRSTSKQFLDKNVSWKSIPVDAYMVSDK